MIGPLTNTFIFCFLVFVSYISYHKIGCFPKSFSKALSWYGFLTVFDFILITIIDLADQDPDADIFKLSIYFEKSGSTRFVGLFMTIII